MTGAARQLHGCGHQERVQIGDVPAVRHQPDLRGAHVRTDVGEQVVVDLHDDPRAPRQVDAVPVRGLRLRATRRPGPEPRRVVELVHLTRDSRATEAGPALILVGVVEPLRLVDLVGRHPEQDDVVDDVGVAGQHVGAGEVAVAGQLGVEHEASVVVGALAGRRRGRVRRRHGQGEPVLALAERQQLARLRLRVARVVGGLRGRLGGRLVGGVVARRLRRRLRARREEQEYAGRGGRAN